MTSGVVVPDASVIIKWAISNPLEEDTHIAMTLLNSWVNGLVNIILPKLWCFEVGNILGLKNMEFAPGIMKVLIGYNFDQQEMNLELAESAFSLMKSYKVTFYDAVYHAVAIYHDGTLLTADDSYIRKAAELGHIMALKDYGQLL